MWVRSPDMGTHSSGMASRAFHMSSAVQLIRSPTALLGPVRVLIQKYRLISYSFPSISAAWNTRSISMSRPSSPSPSIQGHRSSR